MRDLFSAAGRSFLRAFIGSFVVFVSGILAAPDFGAARALSVAALLASLDAGIRAVQAYVPQLSLSYWIEDPFGPWANAFTRAFLSALLVLLLGVLAAPDLNTARALAVAALTGAAAAGVRAVQGAATPGEYPAPQFGVPEPPRR